MTRIELRYTISLLYTIENSEEPDYGIEIEEIDYFRGHTAIFK
jgi:hypothetical protein